jgi:hypothetical protein
LRALTNGVPKGSVGQAFAFLDALPGAIEQGLKARLTTEHDALEIVIIVRNQEHGHGFADSGDDQGPQGATLVQVGAQTRLHICQGAILITSIHFRRSAVAGDPACVA